MKILKDKKLENATIEMEIEVDKSEIASKYDAAFAKIQSEAKLDGFRAGKAPIDMVKQRYAHRADEIVCDEAIKDAYVQALQEKKYSPISYPKIEFDQFSPNENLKFKATFEIYPIVSLKDYKGISAEEKQVKITDEDIDFEVEAIRERFAVVSAKDAALAASEGDLVRIEIKRTDDLAGEDLDKREWGNLNVVAGKRKEEHEFDGYVIGLKINDEKKLNFTYPKDYSVNELAGKKVEYLLRVKEISDRKLPAKDDEFSKDAGFESYDAMKEKIKTDLEGYCKGRAKSEARYAVLDKIVEKGSYEIPSSLIEKEKESVFARFKNRVGLTSFNGSIADFALALGKENENFVKKITEEALKSIKTTLTLTEIAHAENMTVNEEDFSKEITRLAEQGNTSEQEVIAAIQKNQLHDTIRSEILFDKTLEFIYTNGKIKQLSPVSVKEFLK